MRLDQIMECRATVEIFFVEVSSVLYTHGYSLLILFLGEKDQAVPAKWVECLVNVESCLHFGHYGLQLLWLSFLDQL